MRAKIHFFPRKRCLICLESPFIINQCLECSYNMCTGCLKTYLEYNYSQCPQCRVLITTNSPVNQNRSSSSITPLFNLPQIRNLLFNKCFTESNTKFFCNVFIILGAIMGCYYIGYSIDQDNHFLVNAFLGFLVLLSIFMCILCLNIYSIIVYQYCVCNV